MTPEPLDKLETLLRRADAIAPEPPAGAADLAERVRRRARRNRIQKWVESGALAAAVFGVVSVSWWRHPHLSNRSFDGAEIVTAPTSPGAPTFEKDTSAAEAAALRAELERLKLEADVRFAVARRMAALQTPPESEALPAPGGWAARDPQVAARVEVEQAALTLVYQADHTARAPQSRQAALDSYQRVLETFPQTPAADLARRHLAELEKQPGEPS